MKPLRTYLRTGAVLAGLLGATAVPALAASPALAVTVYGSGAAVQKSVQSTWITGSSAGITYTPTNSGGGQAEFGIDTGSFAPTSDATANAVGALDGYTAIDSPITATEQANADTAAGTGTQSLLSIPVAQVSEAIELNVPSGITLNSGQNINLTNTLAEAIFAGTVPASSPYAANTWGALLKDSGLTVAGSTPPALGSFYDSGTNGGNTTISLELRTDGAGATLVLKEYLNYINSTDFPTSKVDENTTASGEWPSGATIAGRASSDSTQANTVSTNPGYVGYGTIGAALGATNAFAASPGAGGTHTLYAFLQDNGTGGSPVYASPLNGTTGASNVYTGTSISTSGTYSPGTQTGSGKWLVPNTKGTLNTTGVWATDFTDPSKYTHGWDVDVYDDTGATTAYYPLDIVLWDLTWDAPAFGTGSLVKPYYDPPTGAGSVESTLQTYFSYVTTAATGQAATVTPHFAPLPTGGSLLADIRADAAKVAGAI